MLEQDVACDDFAKCESDEDGPFCIYSGKLREGEGSAFEAMCSAEFLLHSTLLRFVFTLFAYVMINAGRFFLMAAVSAELFVSEGALGILLLATAVH